MDELYAFLLAYRAIIGAAVLTAIFVILVIAWWDEVKLFFKSFLYSLPLIGKTRRQGHLCPQGWLVRVRAYALR